MLVVMKSKPGQSLTEYGLMLSAVALLSIPALMGMGGTLNTSFQDMLGHKTTPTPVIPPPVSTLPTSSSSTMPSVPAVVPSSASAPTVSALNSSGTVAADSIQVSGANGSAQVLGNSAQLLQLASAIKTSSPSLSNALIKLGQEGQSIAQDLSNGNSSAANDKWGVFINLLGNVANDAAFKKLSASDQQYVKELSNQSAQLTAKYIGFTYSGSGLLDAFAGSVINVDVPTQVAANSAVTVQCGTNGQCSP